jgi:hypothetical protein
MLAAALVRATLVAAALASPDLADAAGRLSIQAALDRDRVALGEEAELTVVVRAEGLDMPRLALGPVRGLRAVRSGDSQSLSWVNGRLSRSTTTLYRVSASTPGRYRIPAIRIASGTERAESAPLTLEVMGSGTGPSSATLPPSTGGSGGAADLFVRLDVDRTRVYWNQPVTARFTFFTRVRLDQEPIWELSEASGFWKEPLGPPRRGRSRVGSHEYASTQVAVAYFPTRTGRLTIGPGEIEARIVRRVDAPDPWSFLGRPEVRVETIPLATDRAVIEVLPLPERAPRGFTGAVGRFAMEVKVDRLAARIGEPVTVTTLLRGEGNLSAAGDPDVRATAPLRSFEAGGGTSVDRASGRLRGERRRDIAFVPEVPGKFAIAPVRFAWFDPEGGRYRTQVSDSIWIRVLPESSSRDSARVAGTSAPPAAMRGGGGPRGSLSFDPPAGAAALAFGSAAAFAAAVVTSRARERAALDPRRRRREALREILATVRAARGAAGSRSAAASRVASLVPQALGLRHDADVEGRSLRATIEIVRARGASEEAVEEARRLVDSLLRLAYAPVGAERAEGGDPLESAEAFVARLYREMA